MTSGDADEAGTAAGPTFLIQVSDGADGVRYFLTTGVWEYHPSSDASLDDVQAFATVDSGFREASAVGLQVGAVLWPGPHGAAMAADAGVETASMQASGDAGVETAGMQASVDAGVETAGMRVGGDEGVETAGLRLGVDQGVETVGQRLVDDSTQISPL